MNKSKRDELAHEYMNSIFRLEPYQEPPDFDECFKAGYDAAMAEAKVLVEALEEIKFGQGCYDKGHEFILDTQDMINIATNALAAYKKD